MRRFETSLCALALLAGCGGGTEPNEVHHEAPPPTNRMAVPELVRRNLGIEFVTVERRRVAATQRVPGHFELLPAARREYRTPIAGRVDVLAAPLQAIAAGDLLYRIESPAWRETQRELGELTTGLRVTDARIAAIRPLREAHLVHEESLRDAAAVVEERVASLERMRADVGGQAAELAAARVQLAQARAELAEAVETRVETEAKLAELEAEVGAGRDRLELALAAAGTVAGLDREQLVAEDERGQPRWRTLGVIDVRAVAAGVAESLPVSGGGWVEVGDLVLATVDPTRLRFRASGLQSDLPRLRDGAAARIVPPQGGGELAAAVAGTLAIGVGADPQQRTVELFVAPAEVPGWARPGVAAFAEFETAAGGAEELAVPLSAVLQDGLHRVLFRRDPKDPDVVIRMDADLGVDDGRWVEVKSGLADGDEVVLAGAYELMLATSGGAAKGGHFHADGTFHPDDHE